MVHFDKERGLWLPETGFRYLKAGAYGVIFFNQEMRKIIKLYKRQHDENHVRAVFKAEVDAYCIATASAALSGLIPGNFKVCTVDQVADKQGHNVTSDFFPDLAFEADFVEGLFCKIGSISSADASRVCDLFMKAGINHTTDMSSTVSCEGSIIKCIDFATRQHELMLDEEHTAYRG